MSGSIVMQRAKTAECSPLVSDAKKRSQRPSVKGRDVRRLIKAMRAEGLSPTAVEVDVKAGLIRVISGKSDDTGSDLDKWLKEHHEGPSQGH
jgi:hypothetical protein